MNWEISIKIFSDTYILILFKGVCLAVCSEIQNKHLHLYPSRSFGSGMLCHKLLFCLYLCETSIKTYDSELQGQEEAGLRNKRVSYLQVALL